MEEEYQAKSYVDTNRLTDYYYDMAYDGVWEEGLRFMAEAYAKVSSVRDGIESERNLQGFFMAYLNLNDYYITAPELELNHGYCDFFLLPDHTHYASQHSYILELKVLSKKEFDEELKDVLKEDGSEEALRRWKSSKATKKAMVDKMQKMLYEDYKLRTGEEPVRFNVLL